MRRQRTDHAAKANRGKRTEEAAAMPSSDDDMNHIYNGRFESALGIEGWLSTSDENAPISLETENPITGLGSLKCFVDHDSGGAGAYQNVQISPSFGHTGQTWQLTFNHKGENTACLVYLDYTGADDVEALAFTATPTPQPESVDIVIPAGASNMQVYFITDWNGAPQEDKTFWVDDVLLKTIALAP